MIFTESKRYIFIPTLTMTTNVIVFFLTALGCFWLMTQPLGSNSLHPPFKISVPNIDINILFFKLHTWHHPGIVILCSMLTKKCILLLTSKIAAHFITPFLLQQIFWICAKLNMKCLHFYFLLQLSQLFHGTSFYLR